VSFADLIATFEKKKTTKPNERKRQINAKAISLLLIFETHVIIVQYSSNYYMKKQSSP